MYKIQKAFSVENKKVDLITLKNKTGMEVKLLSYGATIVEILTSDRNGNLENIVLTHEKLEDYIKNPSYFGATIGRTAGRIENGRFSLGGKSYILNKNYSPNQCHGGTKGFSHVIWDYKVEENEKGIKVYFSYLSKDMEEGYPGNLDVKVIYTLKNDNELIIEYEGTTDKTTLCNLTNHSYFNLSGNYKRKVTEQYLMVKSDTYLELNETQVPTGRYIEVKDTPMDFTKTKLIGRDIESEYKQLKMTKGYDHPWMLKDENNQIEIYDKESGRKMIISTTYPSVVIYSYNFPNNERLKYNKLGSKYDGICFETQYEPNGINIDNLNDSILKENEKYYERTKLKFTVI